MVAVPSWLETLNVAVSVHDPETADIRYANPALGELIERPPSEIESMLPEETPATPEVTPDA